VCLGALDIALFDDRREFLVDIDAAHIALLISSAVLRPGGSGSGPGGMRRPVFPDCPLWRGA
jgi:hypothetical protein